MNSSSIVTQLNLSGSKHTMQIKCSHGWQNITRSSESTRIYWSYGRVPKLQEGWEFEISVQGFSSLTVLLRIGVACSISSENFKHSNWVESLVVVLRWLDRIWESDYPLPQLSSDRRTYVCKFSVELKRGKAAVPWCVHFIESSEQLRVYEAVYETLRGVYEMFRQRFHGRCVCQVHQTHEIKICRRAIPQRFKLCLAVHRAKCKMHNSCIFLNVLHICDL